MADSTPPARRARKTQAPDTERGGYAFCICEIGDKGSKQRKRADEVYKHVISPILLEFGIETKRSDLDPTPGQVTTQIVKSIIESRVLIADLTGRNPNVYYELAVAHAFARPTIILVDSPASLSFDTQNERIISLGESESLGVSEAEDAKAELRKALEVALVEGYQPSNLITEVASARKLDALAPDNPLVQEVASMRVHLEELRELVAGSFSPGGREDFLALRMFVERLVEEDRFYSEEIEGMIGPVTSGRFDQWAHQLAGRASEVAIGRRAGGGYDEGEEPF